MSLRLVTCALLLLLPLGASRAFSPELGASQETIEAQQVPAIPPLGSAVPGRSAQALQGSAADPSGTPTAADPSDEASDPPAASGLPPIFRSETDLPEPVRRMRDSLLAAARSGDIEQLRLLMQAQPEAPAVSLGDPGDPIEYLKALSSDADGREMLAILLELLEGGFVRAQPGTAEELYVWPYFAQYPLESLTPGQLVELFTILTAADYEEMRSYGAYTFFRVGIAPDGRWLFFLAGD